MKRHAAFTLLELMAVLGIISLMIGIILPGLSWAKESAREGTCRSNLRQLGMLTVTAMDQHRQRLFPLAHEVLTVQEREELWGYDGPAWKCPSDKSDADCSYVYTIGVFMQDYGTSPHPSPALQAHVTWLYENDRWKLPMLQDSRTPKRHRNAVYYPDCHAEEFRFSRR